MTEMKKAARACIQAVERDPNNIQRLVDVVVVSFVDNFFLKCFFLNIHTKTGAKKGAAHVLWRIGARHRARHAALARDTRTAHAAARRTRARHGADAR